MFRDIFTTFQFNFNERAAGIGEDVHWSLCVLLLLLLLTDTLQFDRSVKLPCKLHFRFKSIVTSSTLQTLETIPTKLPKRLKLI